MTVEKAIEMIYLRVNGGKPTPDDSVMRSDIKALLPAAVNYAMDKTYNLNLKIEGDRDYPSEFYSVFNDIAIQRDERLPYITTTVGAVPLKGEAGLRFVYDNCGTQYGMVTDSDMGSIEYYSKLTPGMGWYRPTGSKITLYGVTPLAATINLQMIIRVEDLANTDELPLQAGSENDVLELMINWFANKLPYNTLVNTKDVNAVDI